MNLEKTLIGILFVFSFFLFWFASAEKTETKTVFVERVIDGDTVQLNDGSKVRFLGINTPETNMFLYGEAKNFTNSLIENKTIRLESTETDKYGRHLGYIFLGDENVNLEILKAGFAHLYYYGTDKYYDSFKNAEENARESEKGIWKRSENYGCINLVKFVYLDLTEKDKELLILKNGCNVDLTLTIKDDATHIYKEKISAGKTFEKETQNIWNDDGDSIYIWDSSGLIFFYRYP